ncbi:MAG TPA: 7TM domain-containing protein [Lacipirellulaceae bacterium]
MNSRTMSLAAIAVFVLLGGILLGMRYRSLQRIETARQESFWRLTYNVNFEATTNPADADSPPTQVLLAQPFNTRHCEVLVDEKPPWNTIHPELTFKRRIGSYTRTRDILISTSHPKKYLVTATFDLRLSPKEDPSREPRLEGLTGDARSYFLRSEDFIPVNIPQVQAAVDELPDDLVTEAEIAQEIFKYCANIETPATGGFDTVSEALVNKSGSSLGRARAMVAMCRAQKLPARLVTGFEIKQQADARPRVWVEVFVNQRWEPYDPESVYARTLPMTYLPVRRGGDGEAPLAGKGSIVTDEPTNLTNDLIPTFSIVGLSPSEGLLRVDEKHPLRILDLTRLPVPMHDVISILLLLPFGALITAFMRNVVGLQTFGTFAPALLAMSFIYTNLTSGIMILLVVITVGLVGRSLLERLRLLMVPRLSIILTLVILCVVFGFSIMYYFFEGITADSVLLPMVILTILIERFHVTVEEDGLVFALQLAVGTVVVALLCYAVLRWEEIGEFVLTYPEAHFFTIAAFIALGRYAGYRMTELWRFRDLVESTETAR